MDYVEVEDAINAPGLRLVLSAGVPGPWGETAKSLFTFKGLKYLPVRQEGGGENAALQAWTGQSSAPVAVYENLPPVCHWLDLLHLAERLAPAPALLPEDLAQRADVLGLSALIAGVDGFGWQRRLQLFVPAMSLPQPPEGILRMAAKYAWSADAAAAAGDRLAAIAGLLDQRLAAQEAAGREWFVGDAVSAVDFYWANFAGMVKPLPHEVNPMPEFLRGMYESGAEEIDQWLTPRLLAHRDRMYQQHMTLPLDF
jgi:glutathione S-transferase